MVTVTALFGSVSAGWWAGGHTAAPVPATVIEVVDGDTVVVRLDDGTLDTVRLLGIDTPETVHPDKGVECYGPEASRATKDRLTGRRVRLESDLEPRDRYGRRLAYVLLDGARVNDEILREGYARLLVIEPNHKHARALLAAELEARTARRGLWATC